MNDGLAGLAAGILSVAAQIEGMQASVSAAGEQASETLRVLGEAGEGSNNALISDTLSGTLQVIESLDSAAAVLAASADRLHTYLAQRGL